MELKTEQEQAYDWRETGRVIGFYRRSLHLSQNEVARRMGGINSPLSFWERGIKEPKISNLVAVAEILGVSETDLLYPSKELKNGRIRTYKSFKIQKRSRIQLARTSTCNLYSLVSPDLGFLICRVLFFNFISITHKT